jgi:uncharacterized protein (TIGR02594 family)
VKKYYLLFSFLVLLAFYLKEDIEPIIPEINKEIVSKEISSSHLVVTEVIANEHPIITVASRYIGFHERRQRKELQTFLGVDPVRIEWCAAFINSVLAELGIPGSESVSDWPLTARSFLSWGRRVGHPEVGDVVILPRGTEAWQGHVGFYYGTEYVNGKKHYQILGGNQKDAVTIELFPAWQAISIRRYQPPKSK